jgi:hypothetical protein
MVRPDRRNAADLKAMADLCTDFGRLTEVEDVPGLLERAGRLIDASGFIVWVADASSNELRPAVAHGYGAKALARLPAIPRNADNATAAAWRDGEMKVVTTNGMTRGALVAPLLTTTGCIGVLASEIRHGRESSESIRALTRILAAQLAMVVSSAPASAEEPEPASQAYSI